MWAHYNFKISALHAKGPGIVAQGEICGDKLHGRYYKQRRSMETRERKEGEEEKKLERGRVLLFVC